MDVLDVITRVMLGSALLLAIGSWGLAFTGRYRRTSLTPAAQASWDKLAPISMGALGAAALLNLALSSSPSPASYSLAAFALIGWTQDRRRLLATMPEAAPTTPAERG